MPSASMMTLIARDHSAEVTLERWTVLIEAVAHINYLMIPISMEQMTIVLTCISQLISLDKQVLQLVVQTLPPRPRPPPWLLFCSWLPCTEPSLSRAMILSTFKQTLFIRILFRTTHFYSFSILSSHLILFIFSPII